MLSTVEFMVHSMSHCVAASSPTDGPARHASLPQRSYTGPSVLQRNNYSAALFVDGSPIFGSWHPRQATSSRCSAFFPSAGIKMNSIRGKLDRRFLPAPRLNTPRQISAAHVPQQGAGSRRWKCFECERRQAKCDEVEAACRLRLRLRLLGLSSCGCG